MKPDGILSEAPATPDYDDASSKLRAAHSIIDCVAMLSSTGDVDSLKDGSLSATLLHVEDLIDEARKMFEQRETETLRLKAVAHG